MRILLHLTVLYCTVLYRTVLYCSVLYCSVLYCTVLYCMTIICLCILYVSGDISWLVQFLSGWIIGSLPDSADSLGDSSVFRCLKWLKCLKLSHDLACVKIIVTQRRKWFRWNNRQKWFKWLIDCKTTISSSLVKLRLKRLRVYKWLNEWALVDEYSEKIKQVSFLCP